MSIDDQDDQDRGTDAKDEQPSPALRSESTANEVELRLRRDMARFREQARSAQAERDAAIASMRAESDARLIRSELRVAAIKSGIIDTDALRLVDTGHLQVALDGSIEGAEGVIAALKANKPYLFEDSRAASHGSFTTSQPRRPPSPAQPDPVDARTLSRDQWQAERAKVLSRSR